MTKILFIITKSEMGGAQRFLYELITRLSAEKYNMTVAAGGNGELFGKLAEKNIKIIKIRNFSNIPGVKNLLALFEIFGIIAKDAPDIVYLLSSEAGFSGSIVGNFYRFFSRKKLKIIYRIGGWAFKEQRNIIIKKIYLWAEKISAPFKDIIIVNSEFDRQLAIKNKIAKQEKMIVIRNGINLIETKFFPKEEAISIIKSRIQNLKLPARQNLNAGEKIENYILIGTVANLYNNKGLDFLILAAASIKKQWPNWQFVIIGDGPKKFSLEKLIKNHGLENTVFLAGSITNARKYLKAFDLFVLPSVKEGQPWVILEAMAAKIPIVATNIAGIPEMIENKKSGLLVEPADSRALAKAMEEMATHPSLTNECAENAYKKVKEKFMANEMIQKNEEIFKLIS